MKNIHKRRSLVIITIILIISTISLYFLYNKEKIRNIIIKPKTELIEKVECTITEDITSEDVSVLVTFFGTKNIKQIEYHDGMIIYAKNKTKIARDMKIKPFTTYKLNIEYEDGNIVEKTYSINNIDREFNYTGNPRIYYVLVSGQYKLEAYGASGGIGYQNANPVGNGGYTSATTYLQKGQILYIYVGEQGQGQSGAISYNGGGASAGTTVHRGGQGGGATDFRLISGEWYNIEGLKSRILVAGGGGGAQSSCGGVNTTAGHGGGLIGGQSTNLAGHWNSHIAYGGTQTSGGTYQYGANTSYIASMGTFGMGASAGTCSAGGGSGYYGGGSVYTAGGGGGSSFATGYEGCDTTYINYHKAIDGTQIEFKNVVLEQGVNIGYGKAKISLISQE